MVDSGNELGEVADLHRRALADGAPVDRGRPGGLVQPDAGALGAGRLPDRALRERAGVALQRLRILAEVLALDLCDQALEGQVALPTLILVGSW
jgi:hypothetical protein